jgi:nucleoside-diphosphate-sugar epimerase
VAEGVALKPELRGEAFNLVPNEAITVADLVRTVLDVVGVKLEPEIQNPGAHYEEEHLDNTKAKELLGWTPAHDLRAGLQKTLEWYRAHGHG